MAVAEITNLVIEKGTDFETTFNLFDPDNSAAILSGFVTAYSSVCKFPESLYCENFTCIVTAETGTIKLSLSAEQTSKLTTGRNYFDVILNINNKKRTVIKGSIIVEESVSL